MRRNRGELQWQSERVRERGGSGNVLMCFRSVGSGTDPVYHKHTHGSASVCTHTRTHTHTEAHTFFCTWVRVPIPSQSGKKVRQPCFITLGRHGKGRGQHGAGRRYGDRKGNGYLAEFIRRLPVKDSTRKVMED